MCVTVFVWPHLHTEKIQYFVYYVIILYITLLYNIFMTEKALNRESGSETSCVNLIHNNNTAV